MTKDQLFNEIEIIFNNYNYTYEYIICYYESKNYSHKIYKHIYYALFKHMMIYHKYNMIKKILHNDDNNINILKQVCNKLGIYRLYKIHYIDYNYNYNISIIRLNWICSIIRSAINSIRTEINSNRN